MNINVNYCCTREQLYAKMLKETETEKKQAFFATFYHLWHFDWESGPPGYLTRVCQNRFSVIVCM